MKYTLIYCFFALLLVNCSDTPTETTRTNTPTNTVAEDCKYGKPVAVFADTMANISAHEFNLQGQKGTEKVTFATGVQLELVQSGCNNIQQSYNFYLKEKDDTKAANYWAEFAATQFTYMANLDPSLFQLAAYADALNANASQFKLGEKSMLGPGIYLTLDQLWTGEKTLVRVILESDN